MTDFTKLLTAAEEADSLVVRLRRQVDRLVAEEAAMQTGHGVMVPPGAREELERVLDEAADYIESLERQKP